MRPVGPQMRSAVAQPAPSCAADEARAAFPSSSIETAGAGATLAVGVVQCLRQRLLDRAEHATGPVRRSERPGRTGPLMSGDSLPLVRGDLADPRIETGRVQTVISAGSHSEVDRPPPGGTATDYVTVASRHCLPAPARVRLRGVCAYRASGADVLLYVSRKLASHPHSPAGDRTTLKTKRPPGGAPAGQQLEWNVCYNLVTHSPT